MRFKAAVPTARVPTHHHAGMANRLTSVENENSATWTPLEGGRDGVVRSLQPAVLVYNALQLREARCAGVGACRQCLLHAVHKHVRTCQPLWQELEGRQRKRLCQRRDYAAGLGAYRANACVRPRCLRSAVEFQRQLGDLIPQIFNCATNTAAVQAVLCMPSNTDHWCRRRAGTCHG